MVFGLTIVLTKSTEYKWVNCFNKELQGNDPTTETARTAVPIDTDYDA